MLGWLNGAQNYGPMGWGNIPGPEWDLLEFNHWYRFRTTLDFTSNTFVVASVVNLEAGVGATVDLFLHLDRYLVTFAGAYGFSALESSFFCTDPAQLFHTLHSR